VRIPKLWTQTFKTAIIARYRRRESSVEEALIEMYLSDVSLRRVEDITEALWGMRVSPATVSDLNEKEIYRTIETRRNGPIEGEHEVRSLLKPVPGAAQPKPNVRKILDIRSFAVHLHTAPAHVFV
jgi:Transposase, Mutator family